MASRDKSSGTEQGDANADGNGAPGVSSEGLRRAVCFTFAMEWLNAADLVTCGAVSRGFRAAAQSPLLWGRVLMDTPGVKPYEWRKELPSPTCDGFADSLLEAAKADLADRRCLSCFSFSLLADCPATLRAVERCRQFDALLALLPPHQHLLPASLEAPTKQPNRAWRFTDDPTLYRRMQRELRPLHRLRMLLWAAVGADRHDPPRARISVAIHDAWRGLAIPQATAAYEPIGTLLGAQPGSTLYPRVVKPAVMAALAGFLLADGLRRWGLQTPTIAHALKRTTAAAGGSFVNDVLAPQNATTAGGMMASMTCSPLMDSIELHTALAWLPLALAALYFAFTMIRTRPALDALAISDAKYIQWQLRAQAQVQAGNLVLGLTLHWALRWFATTAFTAIPQAQELIAAPGQEALLAASVLLVFPVRALISGDVGNGEFGVNARFDEAAKQDVVTGQKGGGATSGRSFAGASMALTVVWYVCAALSDLVHLSCGAPRWACVSSRLQMTVFALFVQFVAAVTVLHFDKKHRFLFGIED